MAFMAMGNFGNKYVFEAEDEIVNVQAHRLDELTSRYPYRGSIEDINKARQRQRTVAGLKQSNNLLMVRKHERMQQNKKKKSGWAPLPAVMMAANRFKRARNDEEEDVPTTRNSHANNPAGRREAGDQNLASRREAGDHHPSTGEHDRVHRLYPKKTAPGGGGGGGGGGSGAEETTGSGTAPVKKPLVRQASKWDKIRDIPAIALHRAVDGDDKQPLIQSVIRHMARTRRRRIPDSVRKRLISKVPNKPGEPAGKIRRWSQLIQEVEKPVIRWQKDGEAKIFFRRQARKISIILSWGQVLASYNDRLENQLKSFMDIAREIKETSNNKQIEEKTGLAFDPTNFKASRDVQLTQECISYLTLPTHARTNEMVGKVIANLQSLVSFKEYPLHMQERLAKVAWFQELEPRRLILREGHYAENFYFILSGEAVVKKIIPNPKTGLMQMTVLAVLKKGKSFGELALLHHSRRTASIETATVMRMLVISREDFLAIFMNMKDGDEPDHIRFLRTCDFMKNFPVGKIQSFPGACMFHFFGRTTTVVNDSNKNEWLYIVKTGSCGIIKKLKSVEAEKTWGGKRNGPLSLPNLWCQGPVCKVDSWRRSCDARNAYDDDDDEDCDTESIESGKFFATQRDDANNPPVVVVVEDSDAPKLARRHTDLEMTAKSRDRRVSLQPNPSNRRRSSNGRLPNLDNDSNTGTEESEYCESDLMEAADEEDEIEDPRLTAQRYVAPAEGAPGRSRSRGTSFLPSLAQPNLNDTFSQSGPSPSTKPRPHTVPNRPKRLFKPKPSEEPKIERKDMGECFVQLRSLKQGDVFGLEDLEFADEPFENPRTSVTLVSNGAELIMLSKKVFLKLANEHVQRYVREHRRLFPEVENLQINLQTEMNWRLFRQVTSDDVTAIANDIHSRASFSEGPASMA